MTPFTRILVAKDFSEPSAAAVKLAFNGLAFEAGTVVRMVHVLQSNMPNPLYAHYQEHDPADERRARDEAEKVMKDLVPAVRDGVTVEYATPSGDPVVVMVSEAKAFGADVIVVGTHGREGLSGLIMGSVAESLVRAAECPVLVVK